MNFNELLIKALKSEAQIWGLYSKILEISQDLSLKEVAIIEELLANKENEIQKLKNLSKVEKVSCSG